MIPKKDKGQSPVISLRYLNKFVESEYFKIGALHTVKVLCQKGDWIVKIEFRCDR